MKKNIHKITQFSDESLADQWFRTGRNDYIAALLLRHIHFIYGFFLKTATDSGKAGAEVRLFIQRFPSLLQKYEGKEDFASWLNRELATFRGERHTHGHEAVRNLRREESCTPANAAEPANTGHASASPTSTSASASASASTPASPTSASASRSAPASAPTSTPTSASAPASPTSTSETSSFDPGVRPDDGRYAGVIGELENEIENTYPTQNKRNTGLVIFIAAIIVALSAVCLFLAPTCQSSATHGNDATAVAPVGDRPVADPGGTTPENGQAGEQTGTGALTSQTGGPATAQTGTPAASQTGMTAGAQTGAATGSQNNPDGSNNGVSATMQTGTSAASQNGASASEYNASTTAQTPGGGNERYENRVRLVSISENSAIQGSGESGYVSSPKIGLKAYNEYLDKASVRLEEEIRGEVTLTFNVNRYGRPSQIRVTGTLTREAHRESIRLLENGPEWSPAEIPVTIVMRFE